jgi:hypothetical protein
MQRSADALDYRDKPGNEGGVEEELEPQERRTFYCFAAFLTAGGGVNGTVPKEWPSGLYCR